MKDGFFENDITSTDTEKKYLGDYREIKEDELNLIFGQVEQQPELSMEEATTLDERFSKKDISYQEDVALKIREKFGTALSDTELDQQQTTQPEYSGDYKPRSR